LKIQDETGNSLEDLGLMGGWVNNIGNISPSEGYKVKVNRYTEVLVNGPQVTLPFSISLKPGWNIAGYPFPSEVNAMSVVQQLIDRGKLVKVQDDKGNAIEDWGVFGGWQNGIGNFKPGAGYKIKLSAADTLTIFESYPKSSTSVPQTAATVHFSIVGEGNGVDHMNINLVEIPDGFLETRDEIGIFDGGLCVGSMVFGNRYSVIGEKSKIKNQKSEITNISIPISASDGSGLNGFTEGNPFTLKLWKAQTKREYLLDPEIIKGTSTFLKYESTFASLAKCDATGLGNFILADKIDIKIYPNPTNGEIYISAGSSSLKGSEVQVANALGQVILHRIIGSDPDEISISGYVRGVYYITITHDHWSKTEKIILR